MTPPEYLKQHVGNGELLLYKVFGSGLAEMYNRSFATLILPEPIEIDSNNRTLRIPNYDGETFNDSWDITNGGAPMGIQLATDMAALLKDLARIDPMAIANEPSLAALPNLTFDHLTAERYFGELAADLVERQLLTHNDYAKLIELLAFEQTTTPIISNGDFYPRNLIKRPDGSIVLIDWETWNDHSPFYIIDHPENVAATAYVHMWGNSEWQALFRTEISKLFDFSETSFEKGVAIKALTLAHFCGRHAELLDGQITMLKSLSYQTRTA